MVLDSVAEFPDLKGVLDDIDLLISAEAPANLDEKTTGHGTQKPIELMRRPILNHTKRGDGRSFASITKERLPINRGAQGEINKKQRQDSIDA